MCDAHFVGAGGWPPRTIFKTTFKMVHSERCFNIKQSLGNREETNA